MIAGDDLYAILGVLPDAEDIVVAAAYRALAQRYHPDKWGGDPAEAHQRMSDINRAHAVLGDKVRRAEYEKARARSKQAEFTADDAEAQDAAFDSALCQLEDRWQVACGIYPDLKDRRARLARISTSLAFAFVTVLVETRAFTKRDEMASHLERMFLERYFGTNPAVVEYARSLVLAGHKAAAKALNQLVDVVGSDVDADLLIARIDDNFGLRAIREREKHAQENRLAARQFAQSVRTNGYYDDAYELARNLGYNVEEVGGGFFKSGEISVTTPTEEVLRFKNSSAFVCWAQQNLCGSE